MDFLNPCLFSIGILCSAGVDAPAPTPLPAISAENVSVASAPASATTAEATPSASARGSASSILAQVQAYYDGTRDLYAAFSQTYENKVFGTKRRSAGTFMLKQPGMMVWDYTGDAEPDLYVSGDRVAVVEHDTRQVLTQAVGENENVTGAMNFLFAGESLLKDFRVRHAASTLVARYGQDGHSVVELKPRVTSPDYKTMLLVVDDASGRVDAFVIRKHDNSINHVTFSDPQRNRGIRDAQFAFVAPDGYVITKG